jgi:hypothetical protein
MSSGPDRGSNRGEPSDGPHRNPSAFYVAAAVYAVWLLGFAAMALLHRFN